MLKKYALIAITGDSITDCGRTRPIGARTTGIGNGYAYFIDAAISALYPEQKIWVENTGIGGNNSRQLRERFDEDVLSRNPDVVTIMIGINNVWLHFGLGSYFEENLTSYTRENYEADLREMIEKTIKTNAKPVLLTPYFLEPNREDEMRKMCDEFADTVRRLAKEYGTYLCDIQKRFDEYMSKENAYIISNDRVHPNATGHYIIADELLKVLKTIEL